MGTAYVFACGILTVELKKKHWRDQRKLGVRKKIKLNFPRDFMYIRFSGFWSLSVNSRETLRLRWVSDDHEQKNANRSRVLQKSDSENAFCKFGDLVT